MTTQYDITSLYDKKNVMKEIIQEIVLYGLSRGVFFNHAAFYGGSALRIFYGLDRFSEDLDFSLISRDPSFMLSSFFPAIEKEAASYGLKMEIKDNQKSKESPVKSASVKGNTKELMLLFYRDRESSDKIQKNEQIKIKFEIDTDPPLYASFEHKYRLLPVPYEINLYDMPSLFAGKIHAVLCRLRQCRIKGRDLYDYVFYLSRGASVNLKYLRARLIQSGFISSSSQFGLEDIKKMLHLRFDGIDYEEAKKDVLPFIKDKSRLDIWSSDFFNDITDHLAAND